MTLLLSPPTAPTINPRIVRSGKDPRNRPSGSVIVRERSMHCPIPKTHSEQLVAEKLRNAGIQYDYEPTEFELEHDRGFRPDFFLPDYDLYLEVTEGNDFHESRKNKKIQAVKTKYGVTVILIGKKYSRDLVAGRTTINKIISQERAA